MKISILGGGSWGTALAVQLAKNKHQVKIWEFFEEQARKMEHERVCPLLPEVRLSDNIFVSSKMEEVLPDSKLVFIVVPSDKVEVTTIKTNLESGRTSSIFEETKILSDNLTSGNKGQTLSCSIFRACSSKNSQILT